MPLTVVEWTKPAMRLSTGAYLDRALSPPYASHHDTSDIRSDILRHIPHEIIGGKAAPAFDRIFCPFTFNADPFWAMGIENGYLNHGYEPFTVLLYVIRTNPNAMFDMCDGETIECEADYNSIKDKFNKNFLRILNGHGRGIDPGQASVDEMILLGSLFYILQSTCDQSEGLVLDYEKRFENAWCGENRTVQIDLKKLSTYSTKLEGIAVSGMPPVNFFFRHITKTDRNTLWLFNLPRLVDDIDPDIEGNVEPEATVPFMYYLLDQYSAQIIERDGTIAIVFPSGPELIEELIENFNFIAHPSIDKLYQGARLYLKQDFARDTSGSYSLITNYDPQEVFLQNG